MTSTLVRWAIAENMAKLISPLGPHRAAHGILSAGNVRTGHRDTLTMHMTLHSDGIVRPAAVTGMVDINCIALQEDLIKGFGIPCFQVLYRIPGNAQVPHELAHIDPFSSALILVTAVPDPSHRVPAALLCNLV